MAKPIEIAVVLSAYDKMSATIRAVVNANKKRIETLNSVGNSSMIAGAALAGGLGLAVNAAEESQVANNRLRQVFKSMGETTAAATEQSAAYASQLQLQIGIEDEVIMAVQAKLATFRNASNEAARMSGMYNRVTAAAFDMQAAGFGDAMSNITQLGKAFQNPIKGITALTRSGVTFTNAEKKKIQMLVESGKIAQAQILIMKAIESQVGGVAASTATGASKVKIALGEVAESIGNSLLPVVQELASFLINNVIPVIQALVTKYPELSKYVAIAAVVMLGFGAALKVVAFGLSGYNALIGLAAKGTLLNRAATFLASGALRRYAITLVGTVLPAIASAITSMISFAITMATTVWTSLVAATTAVWAFTAALLANPITWIVIAIIALAMSVYLIVKHWDKVKVFFTKLWAGIKQVFLATWNWLKTMFLNYTPYGLIFKHWSTIAAFFVNLWTAVKTIFFKAVSWFIGLHIMFFNAGKNIVVSIWNGIKMMASKPVEAIKAIVKKIRDFLPFSPAKEGPLRDIHRIKLIETIAGSIKAGPMLTAMNGVMRQVSSFAGNSSRSPAMAGNRSGSSITFAPVINLSGTASKQDGDMITSKLGNEFKRLMRDYEANQRRISY